MKQDKLSELLGRPLTAIEVSNFELYLKIARQELEGMLCTALCDSTDPKVYDSRYGYSTVFTDIFYDIEEVKLDGAAVDADKYSARQWDRRSGSWFNSIVFDEKLTGQEVEVSATWGFASLPVDLQLLTARLFDMTTRQTRLDRDVKSKKIEDFTVTYKEGETFDQFVLANYSTVNKYSQCNTGAIRHGRVRPFYCD